VHLYVHVPFCARRCSYCDFAIAVRRTVPSEAFATAVLREWNGWQRHPAWSGSEQVETIYFGGGTPSLLSPDQLARILAAVRHDRPVVPGAEITLEANPDDVTLERAAAWKSAGVTRVSLGVQSFDPAILAWMHRTHTAAQVPEAVARLREAGISDLSLDLIFGLPSALGRDWHSDLARALALAPQHLSVYGLTVEEHTPLERWVAHGRWSPAHEEAYATEFLEADRTITAAGFEHYEVSNYARPGYRARHNSAYWRRAPFIGLGPSSHSAWAGERQWNIREWASYERAMAGTGGAIAGQERLDADAVELEGLYLGLRTSGGLERSRLPPRVVEQWVARGWATQSPADHRVRLTPEGWLRMDALVTQVASQGTREPAG
jgi:oxygen-independent coproporphyrinogen-3 oxidase